MTRLLILVLIVVGVLWWLFGRKRGDGNTAGQDKNPTGRGASSTPTRKSKPPVKAPAQIVACAHCGVHLPQEETVVDSEGRLFCGEAHRLAGPR